MASDTFIYRCAAGCDIKLDLYRPTVARPAPIIFWIHGGALIGGGRRSLQPVLRDLLHARGYAQVSIDYRLAPETKLPAILDDVLEAHRWVRERLPLECSVDANRIGVVGGSAGGYLTLMTGCLFVPRARALVSLYGYGDIVGPWYSAPDPFYTSLAAVTEEEARSVVGAQPLSETPPHGPDRFRFYLWCRQNGRWPEEVMGADPKLHAASFTPFCPERNVTPDYPPTLLLHGTADTDVPYQRSVDMAAALAGAGVTHDFITIEGGGHGFDGAIKLGNWDAQKNTTKGQALLRIVDWFDRFV